MYARAQAVDDSRTICDILAVIQREVLTPLMSLLIVLAVFLFLWGLIEFISGASSEDARTKGKQHMMWGIAGLVIMGVATIIIVIFQNFFEISIPGSPFCSYG